MDSRAKVEEFILDNKKGENVTGLQVSLHTCGQTRALQRVR